MNTLERTAQWMERVGDHLNPILVKEVRQSLKSKQFVATFMLLLVSAWLITVFGTLLAGQQLEYGSAGRGFFYLYYFVLCVAAHVIVPFGAFRALLNERDHNTYELLSITVLKPRQIVWGKLLSAGVQLFIFYSAIAPFIAFTALLEGFDLPMVLFLMTLTLLISLFLSMLALSNSVMGRNRAWQGLMAAQTLGGLVVGFCFWYFGVVTQGLLQTSLPFDDPDFWWSLGCGFVAAASYFILSQQITTVQLTFDSDNRSSGIRLTCAAQFWLFLIGWCVVKWFVERTFTFDPDEVFAIAAFATIHWAVVGLFVATEDDTLSRRVRRNLPKNPLVRLVSVPFLPGGARGFLYVLLHLAVLLLFVAGVDFLGLIRSTTRMQPVIQLAIALCCYVTIYVGLGLTLGRWGRAMSSGIRPAHARVIALLLFAAGMIGPYLPGALGLVRWNQYSLLYLSNPFETLSALGNTSFGDYATLSLLIVAAVGVILLNARAMLRGITDILTGPSPATSPGAGPSTDNHRHPEPQPFAQTPVQAEA